MLVFRAEYNKPYVQNEGLLEDIKVRDIAVPLRMHPILYTSYPQLFDLVEHSGHVY